MSQNNAGERPSCYDGKGGYRNPEEMDRKNSMENSYHYSLSENAYRAKKSSSDSEPPPEEPCSHHYSLSKNAYRPPQTSSDSKPPSEGLAKGQQEINPTYLKYRPEAATRLQSQSHRDEKKPILDEENTEIDGLTSSAGATARGNEAEVPTQDGSDASKATVRFNLGSTDFDPDIGRDTGVAPTQTRPTKSIVKLRPKSILRRTDGDDEAA